MTLPFTHIVPALFDTTIVAAQSTRLGGVSKQPYASLNLGKSTQDDAHCIAQNRQLFFDSLHISATRIALSKQVHGCEILHVTEPVTADGFDALITNKKNVFLAVSVADCVPILIHDRANGAVAAIHAGWRGTVSNIVYKTLEKMTICFGTKPEDCTVFIGACIGYTHFEVDDDVALHFDGAVKTKCASGKFLVDLKTANKLQLLAFGIPNANIEVSPYCTVENNNLFFSHRHEKGITGRMLAVIGMHH